MPRGASIFKIDLPVVNGRHTLKQQSPGSYPIDPSNKKISCPVSVSNIEYDILCRVWHTDKWVPNA